jgi:pyridinium-3,5-biscarboxylic acid mononucleotide sulfurtransferase
MLSALEHKKKLLCDCLHSLESVMIAYSGGVDSSLLAYYARKILGDRAIIVIAISGSLALDELDFARVQSKQFGWDLLEIFTNEVETTEYQRNDAMRCYFCKSVLFEHMHNLAVQNGVKNLAYGANLDDQSDFRPGAQAASEYRVLSPLQEAGLSKDEIRQLAREANLPSWDRPQAACLSSRFPTFSPITDARLAIIDKAESLLRREGFTNIRVRHHEELARIEVTPAEIPLLLSEPGRLHKIIHAFKQLGYSYVTVDLEGYRQGSANLISQTEQPPN